MSRFELACLALISPEDLSLHQKSSRLRRSEYSGSCNSCCCSLLNQIDGLPAGASAGAMSIVQEPKPLDSDRSRLPRPEVRASNEGVWRKAASRKSEGRSPRQVREDARNRAQRSSTVQPSFRAINGSEFAGRGPATAGFGASMHATGRELSGPSLKDRLGLTEQSGKEEGGRVVDKGWR
ncbi:hypothetical protein BCV69DRAFT_129916 [Microstroma glucosiphilum]|uniref:Uncharacterized protein n=1 Tax=Pseudomicrostroma glucosiphilum TaxID=1684307 RepID=A0A316TVZ7_9BASI|nr:hypothetical protein BCV69DRAFT_129916 [Pseudomicrostroma glucosiphilum]PWN17699.1 hypothetical protein BCV69DRAFT_129916 [Pseudomicrostroma glucosiphilum]